ncbi:MAG: putative O-glycosylation ligase, exosortase A system-associated [Rhodothalassiaceae bacterium]
MSSIALFLLFLPMLALTLRWPFVGIMAWFWFGFLNPHRMVYGLMTTLPIAAMIAATTLMAYFFSREPKRLPKDPGSVLLILLMIWVTFTTFFAVVPSAAWAEWEQTIKIMFMSVVATMLLTSRERIHVLVWVTVLSLGFFGFKGGVFTVISGGSYHVWGPPKSFIFDNNQLALALIMLVPLVRYLQLQSEHKWLKIGSGVLLVTCLFSIVGSQSRGALLGLIAMGGLLLMKSRNKLPMFLLGIVMVAILINFVPESWVERMYSIGSYEEDVSAQGRLHAWTYAIKVAMMWPITGGGFEINVAKDLFLRLVPEASKARAFHSIYFEVLGCHGFVGLGIFLGMLWAVWRNFGWVMRKTRGNPEQSWAYDLATMGQVSLFGYMINGAFLNLAFFDLIYLIVTLSGGLRFVVSQELTADQPALQRLRPVGAAAAGRMAGTAP